MKPCILCGKETAAYRICSTCLGKLPAKVGTAECQDMVIQMLVDFIQVGSYEWAILLAARTNAQVIHPDIKEPLHWSKIDNRLEDQTGEPCKCILVPRTGWKLYEEPPKPKTIEERLEALEQFCKEKGFEVCLKEK